MAHVQPFKLKLQFLLCWYPNQSLMELETKGYIVDRLEISVGI